DRVSAFALAASARRPLSAPHGESDDQPAQSMTRRLVRSPFGDHQLVVPPPWPDGPLGRVDDAFQEICLKTDALYPLIKSRPDVAREVLLALLVQPPRPKYPFDTDTLQLFEDLEI